MARSPGVRAAGQITSTSKLDLYTVPAGVTGTAPRLVLTNAAATINTITVSISDGTTSLVIATKTIPGGIGKAWIVDELRTQDLDFGYKVQIQASASTAVNYHLSASEVS